jgi:hypothetical protein
MKKYTIIFLFLSIILLSSCKDEVSDWKWCVECTQDQIIGNYQGLADYTFYLDTIHNTFKPGQNAIVTIGVSGSHIVAGTNVANLFNSSTSGDYYPGPYLQLNGNNQTLSAKIWENAEQLKLIGTVKKTDSEGNTIELLDFEVLKQD